MWRYTMTMLVRAPEVRAGVMRDERRVRVRIKAKDSVDARHKAMEAAWRRNLLVSRFVAWHAKKMSK